MIEMEEVEKGKGCCMYRIEEGKGKERRKGTLSTREGMSR
jgi:hypothetical protein